MKLKLDENLGKEAAAMLAAAGHDIATVAGEAIGGSSDRALIDVCRRERRCLVTLDLDFANPLVFPPRDYAGIVVLRLPPRQAFEDLRQAVESAVVALQGADVSGKLWIVQRGVLREYQQEEDESG